jgi:hypothetical protein
MGRGSLTGLYYVSTSACQHASGLAALSRQHFSFSRPGFTLPCMTNRYQRQSGSKLVVASDDLLKR